MIAGNALQWVDLFPENMLPSIFALVQNVWKSFPKPAPDERENDTSLRLYCAMIRCKDRQKHLFLIRHEDLEIDADLCKLTGRKDIVFYPSHAEDVYFCLEAKRLNAIGSGRLRSLATEYVTKGIQRFVDGKYSPRVRHGGMLGYVLNGDVAGATNKVADAIQKHHKDLGMEPPGIMRPSRVCPHDDQIRETHHSRKHDIGSFQIHHIFASGR